MFYSHRKVGQAGPMTRIPCCTKEEYDKLSDVEKNLVPTHWAPSYTVHPRTGDVYHAYNKPLAVLDWMSKTDVKEDFVLVIDADMIMREPFVPEVLIHEFFFRYEYIGMQPNQALRGTEVVGQPSDNCMRSVEACEPGRASNMGQAGQDSQ
jgi:hypothetical protein